MSSGFVDVVDVPALLVPPPSYQDSVDQWIEEVRGKVGTVDDVWRFFFGDSLVDIVVTPISGNWGELRSLADGWDSLARAATGVQENLNTTNEALAESWEGDAWHASYRHMNSWYHALGDERDTAALVAAFLRDMAENAEAVFDLVIATLNLVIDILLSATKILNAIKALRKAKEAVGLVKKIKKLVHELEKIFDSAVDYLDAIAAGIREGNDNVAPPDGSVAVPTLKGGN